MRSILFCACAFFLSSAASAQDSVIVNQDSSPLQISAYNAAYNPGGTRYSTEGITHRVSLQNSGSQAVVAYQIRFVSFDAFNEDMGRPLGGVAIETVPVGGSANGSWNQRAYASFAFEKYGTGVAYVNKVRLADGTVWNADKEFVLRRLQSVQSDLTAEIFETVEE